MSGWGLANPAGLLWGLLALPIVALHVLRPRRVQAKVSATFLWRQVTTPVTASRPWQRLIPSWLLALQVLTALLLGLLMAQPVRLTDETLADHTIFVIDGSGSMSATDGAPRRIDRARERAAELRSELPAGATASIVLAGNDARALLTHATDEQAFSEALGLLETTDGSADIVGAFALASGLDTSEGSSRVVFISDGGISDADVRAAPVGTRYEAVGTSATNRGITQFSVEPTDGGLLARITVTHFGGPAATQTVRVDVDGITSTKVEVDLGGDGSDVVNLALPVPLGERIEAFLEGEDVLTLDNRAVATVARRPEVQVLWAGPENPFLSAALEASPGLTVTRADAIGPTIDPAIDVIIADGVSVPEGLDLPVFAIAPPGGADTVSVVGEVTAPALTLVRSTEPLVADLDFGDVLLATSQRITVPPEADVLLGAEGAPLLVSVQRPGGDLVYLAFELDQSTLPLQLAFPVLVDRVVADLSELTQPPARLPVGAALPLDPRLPALVTSPLGTSETIAPGTSRPRADRIGFWSIEQEGRPTILVAVSAQREESQVAPAPDLAFQAAFEGTEEAELDRAEEPVRTPIVLAVLALLPVEWLLARRQRGVGHRQWRTAAAVRVAVAAALVAVLIGPSFDRPTDHVATVFLIDASDSLGGAGRASAVAVVRDALATQPDDTRAGIVVFGQDARLESLVRSDPTFDRVSVRIDSSGTDLSAALRLGAASLPTDARQRLVLVTDGKATVGDQAAEIERLATEGIPVDIVVIDRGTAGDVAIGSIETPSVARDGEQVSVKVEVVAPADTSARVTLFRDGDEVEVRDVDLAAGTNTLEFVDTPDGEGVLRYQVEVDAAGDDQNANDVGYAALSVEGAQKILVVEGRAGVADGLEAALTATGLSFDTVTAVRIPSIDDLAQYASIILVDVDRLDLSDGQVAALSAVVRDLGRGMVAIGGTHSFGVGGYRESDLEELLPVISEITDPLRRQTVAEVLAIDTSGSMAACHCDENGENGLGGVDRLGGGVTKTGIARNAAARAIAALAATDEVGVLTMDATDRWAIELQPNPSQDVIDDGLGQLVPDGPTFVDTGLLTAAEALRASNASLKHIIFFSDGFTEPGTLATLESQAADLLAEGITVSVVATGEGAADDLEPIALAGGGRYYPGRNLDQIPELIVQEAIIASRDFINEGTFHPVLASSSDAVRDLTASPALLGYVATTAKPTARVDLRIGPDEDPLLASWRVGLGRVTAWTSDGGERWLGGWNGWDGTPTFWADVIKETFPVASTGGGIVAKIVDGQLQVAIEGTVDWPADAVAKVRVAGPDGTSVEVPLERIDAATFSATTAIDAAGVYAIGGQVSAGETLWAGVGLTTRSYPAEYAPLPAPTAELAEMARSTGGRLDPDTSDLFSAVATDPGRRLVDLTRWLLLFALLAWPVAVALSRLAWPRGVAAIGNRRAADTVTALRQRLPKMTDPELRPRPPTVEAPPPRTATSKPVTPAPAPPPVATPAAPADRDEPPSGSTVNRLLDRKRNRPDS